MTDQFCEWEGKRFPSDQFVEHPDHGLVHEHRSDPMSPRHTVMGDEIGGLRSDFSGGAGGGGGRGLIGKRHGGLHIPGDVYTGPAYAPHT